MAAPSPAFLFARVQTQINGLAHLTPGNVFDTHVPQTLPVDVNGFIKPYVVLFAGAVNDLPEERDLTNLPDMSISDFRFQTTCVGPTGQHARELAHTVRLALSGLAIGAGFIKPDPDAFRTDVLKDDQVTPARFYMPLMWRLTTT
jgi:hypothetical protein